MRKNYGVSFVCLLVNVLSVCHATDHDKKSEYVNAAGNQQSVHSGLFFGFQGGFLGFSVRNHYVNTNSHPRAFSGYRGKESISGNGGLIGTHFLLGHVFKNNFYLGSEISACYHFVNSFVRDAIYFGKSIKYSQTDSYSIAFRTGALIGSILIYGKHGIALTHRIVETFFPGFQYLTPPISISKKYKKGLLMGIGAEKSLTEKFILGFETEYTLYGKDHVSHTNAQDYQMRNNNFSVTLKIRIKL